MMMFAHFEERKGKKALVWIISVVKYLLRLPCSSSIQKTPCSKLGRESWPVPKLAVAYKGVFAFLL